MTQHKVECFEHNGEPYGRYVNPYFIDNLLKPGYAEFESFVNSNKFPFPGGTIGKTYERGEVEVQYHMKEGERWYRMGHGERMMKLMPERKWKRIFHLIHQPAEKELEYGSKDNPHVFNRVLEYFPVSKSEKEPETVEMAAEKILGRKPCFYTRDDIKTLPETFILIGYSDAIEAMKEIVEWQKQQLK